MFSVVLISAWPSRLESYEVARELLGILKNSFLLHGFLVKNFYKRQKYDIISFEGL
jgi:hypothetical protein